MKKWEDSLQEKAKNIWERHKVATIIFIIVFPLVIQILFSIVNIFSEMELWNFKFPDSSNWIGFWGSYLGIVPSGLIAYAVARYQIESDKKERSTEESMRNLPYLTIDLDQPIRHYKQDNVYNYIVDYFIKFSAYNTFYPIRAVTIFLYFNTVDDDEYVLKDTILLGDISPCVDDFTHVRFDFDNEHKNLDTVRLIIYGRLIDGRVVKIQADKDKSSHLYMTDEKVWYSYEPEPLEDSFDELEKAEIRERR
ncbi:hypothetical protein [Leuconostoc mesenteroides]|uniref:hypothetical protein n=1 Tax=Leuconostoc mesenteroides TaxID=1245 RepID=UPI0023612854|nr:hypothetical protein [Leuconostoc mesenteroides]